jgi:hypothetical protein
MNSCLCLSIYIDDLSAPKVGALVRAQRKLVVVMCLLLILFVSYLFIFIYTFLHHLDLPKRLKYSVKKEFNNPIPAPNSGSLAFNDTLHIVSGPSGAPFLYAYKITENITHPFQSTVTQSWNISTVSSLVEARVQTAFNDELAYYVESEGALVCIETLSGAEKWRHQTGGHVRADFVIIDDEYLAFATTNGYTSLLRIGETSTESPSGVPTEVTSMSPSVQPTALPTLKQSNRPSTTITESPSGVPTEVTSMSPSVQPTALPTLKQSNRPSTTITESPSGVPTEVTSMSPSMQPTALPTLKQSNRPSTTITGSPSGVPTKVSSMSPSVQPTALPTLKQSNRPSTTIPYSPPPTRNYTSTPSSRPTLKQLTPFPTPVGTPFPTVKDSDQPSETAKPSINDERNSTGSAVEEVHSAAYMIAFSGLKMITVIAWLVC